MQQHSKILLVVLISLLPWFNLGPQAFAQTNDRVKILVTDAIEDLQNNNTGTALTHSNLASQELSSQGVSSSDSALVLIHDAIQDLLNNNTDIAFTHLSLASEQLELPSDDTTTTAVSLNKTSLNTTLIERQRENATITVGKDECTDNNLNGRCSLDEPKSAVNICTDVNHDLYCDWFRPVNNGNVIPPLVTAEDACYNDGFDDGSKHVFRTARDSSQACSKYGDYFYGFIVGCTDTGMLEHDCEDIAANATSPQPQPAPVQITNPSKGNNSNFEEYCEDFDGDGFCDITHLSDGTTLVEDQEEIERLKEGNDGLPDIQQERQQEQRPSGSISLPVQPQQNRINWGAICKNPIVDSFISEPCETLTSPDGFILTSRGQRVLVCLGVGGIAAYLDPEILGYIKSLGPAVGCGTGTGAQTGEPSTSGQGNALDTILGGLFRK